MNPDAAAFVAAARMLAEELLTELPERLRHSGFVAVRAAQLSLTVPADAEPILIAAAWLHDIGYAEALRRTGSIHWTAPTT